MEFVLVKTIHRLRLRSDGGLGVSEDYGLRLRSDYGIGLRLELTGHGQAQVRLWTRAHVGLRLELR